MNISYLYPPPNADVKIQNINLFEAAFTGPADLFEAEYDFKRPKKDQPIIVVGSGRANDDRDDT